MKRRPQLEMTMGELIDKRSIIKIKISRGIEADKLAQQQQWIDSWLFPYILRTLEFKEQNKIMILMTQLFICNNKQFDFEDQVLELGGEEGLRAAKNSRKWNQHRAMLKRQIDEIFGEKYLEVKKYSLAKHS